MLVTSSHDTPPRRPMTIRRWTANRGLHWVGDVVGETAAGDSERVGSASRSTSEPAASIDKRIAELVGVRFAYRPSRLHERFKRGAASSGGRAIWGLRQPSDRRGHPPAADGCRAAPARLRDASAQRTPRCSAGAGFPRWEAGVLSRLAFLRVPAGLRLAARSCSPDQRWALNRDDQLPFPAHGMMVVRTPVTRTLPTAGVGSGTASASHGGSAGQEAAGPAAAGTRPSSGSRAHIGCCLTRPPPRETRFFDVIYSSCPFTAPVGWPCSLHRMVLQPLLLPSDATAGSAGTALVFPGYPPGGRCRGTPSRVSFIRAASRVVWDDRCIGVSLPVRRPARCYGVSNVFDPMRSRACRGKPTQDSIPDVPLYFGVAWPAFSTLQARCRLGSSINRACSDSTWHSRRRRPRRDGRPSARRSNHLPGLSRHQSTIEACGA